MNRVARIKQTYQSMEDNKVQELIDEYNDMRVEVNRQRALKRQRSADFNQEILTAATRRKQQLYKIILDQSRKSTVALKFRNEHARA